MPQPAAAPAQGSYGTPYTNGHTTTGLSLPDARASATPPLQTPQTLQTTHPQYTMATMAPVVNGAAGAFSLQTPGVMGPPQRPAERPTKDYEYDVTDSLAGTGIDLRAEEQYMVDLYALDANTEARTGFAQHPAGSKSSLYGAGPANQPAQPNPEQDQNRFAAQAAAQAWHDSSMKLGAQRTQELNSPFLLTALLHRRSEKIAKEHHIGVNLDLKNSAQPMGRMRVPDTFPTPKVTVKMTPGPDSVMVHTTGSYIPQDAFLVDQLALLSIATKHRLRELLQDANIIAANRQQTSHGEVPETWEPAAAPLNKELLQMDAKVDDAAVAMDVDDAMSPGTNPLKRKAFWNVGLEIAVILLTLSRLRRCSSITRPAGHRKIAQDRFLRDDDNAGAGETRTRVGRGALAQAAAAQGRCWRPSINAVSFQQHSTGYSRICSARAREGDDKEGDPEEPSAEGCGSEQPC